MRALGLTLFCVSLLVARPAPAQVDLPSSMPPRAAPSEIDRNIGLALGAWEKMRGYGQPSKEGALVVRDFAPVPLADGSIVIPGLGVHLRPTTEANREVLEIVDMREYGAFWTSRGEPPFGIGDIGGLINGNAFSLDQHLRTALSKSASNKLKQGFSIQISPAVPYLNHNNEPRVQLHHGQLSVKPLARPMGRWIVAEPEAEDAGPSPQEEYEQLISAYRAMLEETPCGVTGAIMMDYERQTELLEIAAGEPLPDVNFRHEQAAACGIARHGPYDLSDLERLAVLRSGDCADVSSGLSAKMTELAKDLQLRVAPPDGYLRFSEIGLYDLRDPSRRGLSPEDGASRKACVLAFLEDDLFAAP